MESQSGTQPGSSTGTTSAEVCVDLEELTNIERRTKDAEDELVLLKEELHILENALCGRIVPSFYHESGNETLKEIRTINTALKDEFVQLLKFASSSCAQPETVGLFIGQLNFLLEIWKDVDETTRDRQPQASSLHLRFCKKAVQRLLVLAKRETAKDKVEEYGFMCEGVELVWRMQNFTAGPQLFAWDDEQPLDCVFDVINPDGQCVSAFEILRCAQTVADSYGEFNRECMGKVGHDKMAKFPVWAIHPPMHLPGLVAEHLKKTGTEHSLFLCQGHFIRVFNNESGPSKDQRNYASCILPACPEVYKIQLPMEVNADSKSFLKKLEILVESKSLAELDIEKALAVVAFVAAHIAMYLGLIQEHRERFSFVRRHHLAAAVMRDLIFMFKRFNPIVVRLTDSDGLVNTKIDVVEPDKVPVYAAAFANQILTQLMPALDKEEPKKTYPNFAARLDSFQQEIRTHLASALTSETDVDKYMSLLYNQAIDSMDIGLGKTLLGLGHTVVIGPRHSQMLGQMLGIPRVLTKQGFDELVRKPIFRDENSDPAVNSGSAFAEIAVAMAFSELVRNPTTLLDIACFAQLPPGKGQSQETRYFSEHGPVDVNSEVSVVPTSWTGPYGRSVNRKKWAGTWPMSHTGSVKQAERLTDPRTCQQRVCLNAVELKSMRLFARFISFKLSCKLQRCWLVDPGAVRMTDAHSWDSRYELHNTPALEHVMGFFFDQLEEWSNEAVDFDTSLHKPDTLPLQTVAIKHILSDMYWRTALY